MLSWKIEEKMPAYINEATMSKHPCKGTFKYVVKSKSIDSISIVFNSNHSDSIITIMFGIISNSNPIDNLKLYSFENNIHKNENETFGKLIILISNESIDR